MEPTIDPLTHRQYQLYVTAHFQPFFEWTERLTKQGVEDYVRHRLRKVTRSTVARELGVLRRICVYGAERGLLDAAPEIDALPRTATGTRVWHREYRVLEPEQVERLLKHLPEWADGGTRSDPYPVRARWIVAWETGLRPATLDALRAPEDYRRGARELGIRDEADKARFGRALPLTPRAREALDGVLPPGGGLIFGHHDHRPHLERAAAKARLGHVAPYDLRHSRLTYWASVSTDLTAIGYLAGHRHATTTARYVHQARRGAETVLAAGFRTHSGRGSPDGQTVGSFLAPQIERAYTTGDMPTLLPGLPAPEQS